MRRIRWWLIVVGLSVGLGIGAIAVPLLTRKVDFETRAIPKNYQQSQLPSIKIETDPQYVVINFARMNEYIWHAPETEWQQTIKPKVVSEIRELKAALPAGNQDRKLAWSTLMEYMNFPYDEPSSTSPYVVKVRRIFEITREENIPVFLPLNGFQWWDELPELYNWWDSDGTKTDQRFFTRQENPADFKQRFIKGYDPNNKYNVEWQDWQSPMELNWRNWGGGGFRLAPPPNIVGIKQNSRGLSYRIVQRRRFESIVREIVNQVQSLEADGKTELFAGISIGTEVSLNASATPKDEFEPYGYRAMQDLLEREQASASTIASDVLTQHYLRQKAVQEYLADLSWLAVMLGMPTQRIYTHVWSEAEMGESRFVDYAAAAYNPYSRPGISLYGFATKPLALPVWQKALSKAGWPAWGAVELSLPKTDGDSDLAATNILATQLENRPHAQVAVLYNWDEHNNSTNLQSLRRILSMSAQTDTCSVPEIFQPTVISEQKQYVSINPVKFEWRWEQGQTMPKDTVTAIHLYKGARIIGDQQPDQSIQLDTPTAASALVPSLDPGVYTWQVVARGCQDNVRRSQPQHLVVPRVTHHSLPAWTQWALQFLDWLQSKNTNSTK